MVTEEETRAKSDPTFYLKASSSEAKDTMVMHFRGVVVLSAAGGVVCNKGGVAVQECHCG